MPPYTWIHLESVWWVLAGGLIVALAIILARGSLDFRFTMRKRNEAEYAQETHRFGDVVSEQNRPVPIFIWLVTIGYVIWAVAYVIFSGTHGL